MKKYIVFLFIFVLGCTSRPSVLQLAGGQFYVSEMGVDINPCTLAAPCKTYARAQNIASIGDTIHITGIIPSISISKTGLIIEGGTVDAIANRAANSAAIAILANNITIRNMEVINGWSYGIRTGAGYGDGLIVDNVKIHNNVLENKSGSVCLQTKSSGWGSAFRAYYSSNIIIKNSRIYENCGEGLSSIMSNNITGTNLEIYDNFSVNIYPDQSQNFTVTDSVISCIKPEYQRQPYGSRALLLGAESYTNITANLSDNVSFQGNKVYNCRGVGAYSETTGGWKNIAVIGNEFYNVSTPVIASIVGNNIVLSPNVILSISNTPATQVYYVSPNGLDANAGTIAAPWLTVRKALTALQAGDTLYLRGGTYNAISNAWYFTNSGTAAQPITITNYPNEQVIFNVSGMALDSNYAFKCTPTSGVTPKADYIRIIGSDVSPRRLPNGVESQKGLIILGVVAAQAPGIMSIDCDNWEVAGVDFVDVAYGIFTRKINNGANSANGWYVHDNRVYGYYRESGMQFNGNHNRIENNEIYKVNDRLDTPFGCQLLNLLGNNNIVKGNTLSRLGSSANCLGILFEWDVADANLIENNIITDVPRGISFRGGDGNVIRNNVITGVGSGVGVIAFSHPGTQTSWPCDFSPFMPLESDTSNPDWPYYYPHDCHSKNNLVTGNAITGFSAEWQMSPLQEPSNIYQPFIVSTNTPTVINTVTPSQIPSATFTVTLTPIPPTATRTPTPIPSRTPTASPVPPTIVPTVCEFSPSYMICTRP